MPMCGISAGCGQQRQLYTLQLHRPDLSPSTDVIGSVKTVYEPRCDSGKEGNLLQSKTL